MNNMIRDFIYHWLYKQILRFAESPEYKDRHWPWAQWQAYMTFVRQVNSREDSRRLEMDRVSKLEDRIRDMKIDIELLEKNSFVIPPQIEAPPLTPKKKYAKVKIKGPGTYAR